MQGSETGGSGVKPRYRKDSVESKAVQAIGGYMEKKGLLKGKPLESVPENREPQGLSDITLGNRNESIFRRLFFKTLEKKVPELITDFLDVHKRALAQAKEKNKTLLMNIDMNTRCNFIVTKPVTAGMRTIQSKKIPLIPGQNRPAPTAPGNALALPIRGGGESPPKRSGRDKSNKASPRKDQPLSSGMAGALRSTENPYVNLKELDQIKSYTNPGMLDFFAMLRRHTHYETIKVQMYLKTIEIYTMDDRIFPGISYLKQTVNSNFTLNSINNFFWSSICLKKVSNVNVGSQTKNLNQQLNAANEKAQKELEKLLNGLQNYAGIYEDTDKGQFSFAGISKLELNILPNFEELMQCYAQDDKKLFEGSVKPLESKFFTEMQFNTMTVGLEFVGHQVKKKGERSTVKAAGKSEAKDPNAGAMFGMVAKVANEDEFQCFDFDEVGKKSFFLDFF